MVCAHVAAGGDLGARVGGALVTLALGGAGGAGGGLLEEVAAAKERTNKVMAPVNQAKE